MYEFLSRYSFNVGDFKRSGPSTSLDMIATLDTGSIYIKNTSVTNITLHLNDKEESIDMTSQSHTWSRGSFTVDHWIDDGGSAIRLFDDNSILMMTIGKVGRLLQVTIDPDLFHLYRNDLEITIVISRVKRPPQVDLAKLMQPYLDKLIER